MPAYVIAEVEITDPAAFQDYVAAAIPTLAPYGGRIVANSAPDPKEGARPAGNIVIAAFDSMADAQKWYHSEAYGPAIKMRQRAANTRLFIVEGLG
jgi:uncharacterized protein (DUF1330 family)